MVTLQPVDHYHSILRPLSGMVIGLPHTTLMHWMGRLDTSLVDSITGFVCIDAAVLHVPVNVFLLVLTLFEY